MKTILLMVIAVSQATVVQHLCRHTRENCNDVLKKTMFDTAVACMSNATSNVDFSRDDFQHEYIGVDSECNQCKRKYFHHIFGTKSRNPLDHLPKLDLIIKCTKLHNQESRLKCTPEKVKRFQHKSFPWNHCLFQIH